MFIWIKETILSLSTGTSFQLTHFQNTHQGTKNGSETQNSPPHTKTKLL
jgi:hypothetical protein